MVVFNLMSSSTKGCLQMEVIFPCYPLFSYSKCSYIRLYLDSTFKHRAETSLAGQGEWAMGKMICSAIFALLCVLGSQTSIIGLISDNRLQEAEQNRRLLG